MYVSSQMVWIQISVKYCILISILEHLTLYAKKTVLVFGHLAAGKCR